MPADPNALGNHAQTPLSCAIRSMRQAGIRLLLERGAQANLKVKRKDYEPPLYAAACVINATSSKVLRNGKLVLEVAEIWERRDEVMEVFRALIAAGADPNAPGARNQTALQNLVRGDEMPDDLRLPLIDLLMNAGARPDLPDKDGHTPIAAAALYKNPRVIERLSRPVQPPTTKAAPSQPAKETKATKPVAARSGGASDFLKFISDGEAEWALLAIKAPIDQTTEALAAFLKSGSVKPNVPIRKAAKDMDEVAKAIAVVSVASNPWTVVFLSLFYASEAIIKQAEDAARSLSRRLKTTAVVYAGEDTSEVGNILQFEMGDAAGDGLKMVDEDEADKIFSEYGIYLPACYPKMKATRAWLAVEKASADRIERADLVVVRPPDRRQPRPR